MTEQSAPTYTEDDIEVLEGLEPVRRRPVMYVGDVRDGSGLRNLLWGLVSNCIDLYLNRSATSLRIDVDGDWVEVEDDGPGIPIGSLPKSGKSAVEIIFTVLPCGRRPGHDPLWGLFGVDLAVINALSAELEVETRRDGFVWRQSYRRGIPLGPLERVGRSARTGTRIRFRADPTVFPRTELDRAAVRERLHELAYLNPALTIHCGGETLRERAGIGGRVAALARGRGVDATEVHVIEARDARTGARVELAMTWAGDDPPEVHSFVGQERTREGGQHVEGVWRSLCEVLRPGPIVHDGALRELIAPGLIAVVHVGLLDPRFAGSTRERLVSPEAADLVREALSERLSRGWPEDVALLEPIRARL